MCWKQCDLPSINSLEEQCHTARGQGANVEFKRFSFFAEEEEEENQWAPLGAVGIDSKAWRKPKIQLRTFAVATGAMRHCSHYFANNHV
jgi:hypothetical protein